MRFLLLLLTLISISGCFNYSGIDSFRDGVKTYLKNSIKFNENFIKENPNIKLDLSKNWYQITDNIEYSKDNRDIMRCPEYIISNGNADCDGFAMLSTKYEKLPFLYYVAIESKTLNSGHVIACYKEKYGFVKIYSCKIVSEYLTLEEYLEDNYKGQSLYIALISSSLSLQKTYSFN